MVKRNLRRQLQIALDNLSADQIHQKSQDACSSLIQTEPFQQSRVVMVFLSMDKEVETSPVIRQALEQGKTVVVPKVLWQERRIVAVKLPHLDCEMEIDQHGLRNPKDTEEIPVIRINLVVVPGLGFDKHGNRLGRGGGYYDRFFGHNRFHGTKCGLGFEEQLVDEIPMLEHDISLDMLVTDKIVRRFDNLGYYTEENYQDTEAKDG